MKLNYSVTWYYNIIYPLSDHFQSLSDLQLQKVTNWITCRQGAKIGALPLRGSRPKLLELEKPKTSRQRLKGDSRIDAWLTLIDKFGGGQLMSIKTWEDLEEIMQILCESVGELSKRFGYRIRNSIFVPSTVAPAAHRRSLDDSWITSNTKPNLQQVSTDKRHYKYLQVATAEMQLFTTIGRELLHMATFICHVHI